MSTEAELRAELDEARRRIAELETVEAERRDVVAVQSALFQIAEAAGTAADMQEFYAAVHAVVGELVVAKSFYIALYDAERRAINFPFYRDEVDEEIPDPAEWVEFGEGNARGLTAYVLRTGEPLLVSPERLQEMIASGDVEQVGAEPVDWLGVPLVSQGRTIGAVVVQTYEAHERLTDKDREIFTFVAQHIAAALERTRLLSEMRQRVAELATVNSIGEALADQQDTAALIELVGERIRETFEADIAYVALHDPTTGTIDFPYYSEAGTRSSTESIEFGEGLTSRILRTREPLLLNQREHYEEVERTPMGTRTRSFLGVPILVGHEAIGVISVQSINEAGQGVSAL